MRTMAEAFINRIATAVPPHDVHDAFLAFGRLMLQHDKRRLALFDRMAMRSGIAHRYSFLAPIEACGLKPSVERTMVGFMGCHAAINGLKLARHIVRSEPGARVLAVNVELCTLHLQETANLEEILSFLLFADGCAAALVSA